MSAGQLTTPLPAVLDRFPQVWCVDFEFMARSGERPEPVCCVAWSSAAAGRYGGGEAS